MGVLGSESTHTGCSSCCRCTGCAGRLLQHQLLMELERSRESVAVACLVKGKVNKVDLGVVLVVADVVSTM